MMQRHFLLAVAALAWADTDVTTVKGLDLRGWYSGEGPIHYPRTDAQDDRSLATFAQAEDLKAIAAHDDSARRAAMSAGQTSEHESAAQAAASSGSCIALRNIEIPAERIGLPTRGAKFVGAETFDNDRFCKVKGAIASVDARAPDINFVISLPSHWNGKAIHLGGAAYNGALLDLSDPTIARGFPVDLRSDYAIFLSDSGHQGWGYDASFAINREALENFAGAQLKKVHDVAVEALRRYYGKPPRRMYFWGGSQGGREGLIIAQRYPTDYDGVVSLMPAYNFTAIMLSGLTNSQRLYHSEDTWLSPAKTNLITSAVLAACDPLDGLADGIIANVSACRSAFNVRTLRCSSGRDEGSLCLSDAQIATAEMISRGVSFGFDVSGASHFSGLPIFEGALTAPSTLGFGTRAVPSRPPTEEDSVLWRLADQAVRYIFLRDPTFDALTFNPKQHVEAIQRVSDLMDASSPNLDVFQRRGGKLLLMQGTVDTICPPGNTIAYYESLKARYGAKLRKFTRFYTAPGYGHGDGPFRVYWDALSTLDRWVNGIGAPGLQTMVDESPDRRGRSLPLCEYPAWPKYRGIGDPNDAGSFRCVSSS